MLKRVVVITLLLLGSTAQAGDLQVYVCDTPHGYRADYPANNSSAFRRFLGYFSEGIVWQTDGFSGVRPIVIWNEAERDKLLVSWGHADPLGLLNKSNTIDWLQKMLKDSLAFKKATVLSNTEHSIQAVYAECNTCVTHLYGLFPTLQLLTMSDVNYSRRLGSTEIAGAARLFASRCKRVDY